MKISFETVLLVFAMVKSCQSCGPGFIHGLVTGVLGYCATNRDCGEDKQCIDNTCQANPQDVVDLIKCDILQINGQVNVSRGQILKTFPNWGPKYKVEFDITVNEVPTAKWTNVLHFYTSDPVGNRLSEYQPQPSLWVNKNGFFSIETSTASHQYQYRFDFTKSQKHHISIQQVPEDDDNAIITFEVDGKVINTEVNNIPQTFHDVQAYVSTKYRGSQHGSFNAKYGSLENLVAYHNCFSTTTTTTATTATTTTTTTSQANPQMTKILIATGFGDSSSLKNIEIVDLQGGQQCTWQYPIAVSGATGGLMPGGEGIICGGQRPSPDYQTDVCHLIPSMETITMKKKRSFAASLVFNGRLLVAGGYDENDDYLKSTEWVSATTPHTEEAGDMPIHLGGHTMELISIQGQPYAMAIGGQSSSGASSKTFLGNLNGSQIQWTEGPPLMTGRAGHASAVLQHQGTTYIVVSGGWGGGRARPRLDSVEIWKVTSTPSEWIEGPRLPKAIGGASMVSLGTKVILLGGADRQIDWLKDIYQLSSPHGDWQKLFEKLKRARSGFVAFTIPKNWTHCY